MTWARTSFTATLCAWFPVSSVVAISLLLHGDRPRAALDLADAAALAVLVVHDRPALHVQRDRDVRAELPADVAPRAFLEVDHGPEGPPRPRELDGAPRGHAELH